MNELIWSPRDKFEQGLKAADNDQLFQQLSQIVINTGELMWRAAMCVRELESRGVDMAQHKGAMIHTLRLIASGNIIPAVVLRFGEFQSLMLAVGKLPKADQQRLGDGDMIELVIVDGSGEFDYQMADPLAMSMKQVRQVFADRHIRSVAEQQLYIKSHGQSAIDKPKPFALGLTRAQKRAIEEAAGAAGLPVQAWARDMLLLAAGQEIRKQ